MVQELLKDRDVARIALSVLQKPENRKTTRKRLYPTYPPWEKFMKDVGKVRLTVNPQKKTLDKIWNWLSVSVSPSLKLMWEIGKLDERNYIGLLVENGKMNDIQQRIYEDYKKSFLLGREASEYTGIGRNNLRKLIAWQKIPVIRIGNKILIRTEVLDRLLKINEGHNLKNKYEVIAV